MKRRAIWRKGEWKRREYTYQGQPMAAEGYEIDFILDGAIQASFIGVPDYKRGIFKLRGTIIFRYAKYIPRTRKLPMGSEDKEFEIEVK